jgi:glycosyltransferase involved in cell wall biosynthesis
MKNTIRILGTRGIPAAHGGFETFAERLALHLAARDWKVAVYCQESGSGAPHQDTWQGIERIIIPVSRSGPAGTVIFDWKAAMHAARSSDPTLTLGYNTAVFNGLVRFRGAPVIINMDGIEWARMKWGPLAKLWLRMNERAACRIAHHLVADHPEIRKHLERLAPENRITMIPYGADEIDDAAAEPLESFGLAADGYLTMIARPEPENSILEIVRGFSAARRGCRLVVLGDFHCGNRYHREVKHAASDEVMFLGALYDQAAVRTLRRHCIAHLHGHQVGGTNPSLVEAMAAGNAIIAHDNRFNRWVAGDAALYFSDTGSFERQLGILLGNSSLRQQLRAMAKVRFREEFTWPHVLARYESLLCRYQAHGGKP